MTFLSEGQQTIAVVEGNSHTLTVVSEIGDDGNGDKLAVLTFGNRRIENSALEGAGVEVAVGFVRSFVT